MTASEVAAFAALGVALLTGGGGLTYYLTERRKARIEKDKADAEETRAKTAQMVAEFGANLELNEYIDRRVEKLVADQVKPMREELNLLKTTERNRTLAMTRILRSIANQWPLNSPGPFLDPTDIAAVEDTIPPPWLKPPVTTATPKE